MGALFPMAPRQGTAVATGPAHPGVLGRFGRLTERPRPFTVSFSINQVGKVVIAIGGAMKVRVKFAGGLLAAGMLLAAGCGGSGGSGGSDKLTLVAYSTPREAHEALIPGFQKTDAGQGISVSQSY